MRQLLIPGHGFLFHEGGLTLPEMARKCHEAGVLTDEEFAEEGGVPALRRYLYAMTWQGMDFFQPGFVPDDRARRRQRLAREANAYAEAQGLNDPKYVAGVVTLEDLEAFHVPVAGKNLVNAELLLTLVRNGRAFGVREEDPTAVAIAEMARWIFAGRPSRTADGCNSPCDSLK